MEATLETVKAGDIVIVRCSGTSNLPRRKKVDKVTATQIVIGDDRYNKVSGKRLGDSGWNIEYVHAATPNLIAQSIRAENLTVINSVNFKALTDEQLQQIADILRVK